MRSSPEQQSPDPDYSDALKDLGDLDDSSGSPRLSDSSDRTVIPARERIENEPAHGDDEEEKVERSYRLFRDRNWDDHEPARGHSSRSSQHRGDNVGYNDGRPETIDEDRSHTIDTPRGRGEYLCRLTRTVSNPVAGASPPRFPRAVYRNGRLEDYDLAAGGSGPWSIDEEDSPAATFGGRADRWDEESQHRRNHSHEGTDRFAGSPETDPEPFISACLGRIRSRMQSQDVPNAGSSRGAQPQPQLYQSPQTAYDIAIEVYWRRVENAYWMLVLYGYVDRAVYPYLYRDFHPPAEEIFSITRQYWTLIMQRGIHRFRVPVWGGIRFGYRAPFVLARPGLEEGGAVGISFHRSSLPRSPRSPW